MKSFVFLSACLLSFLSEKASFAHEPASSEDSAKQFIRNPGTAIIFSAVLPGLGQVYNRKYWKVPLVYGAGGAALYSYRYYQTRYKKIMEFLNENDAQKTYYFHGRNIKSSNLTHYRDYYHRYRDISIFSLAGVYLLNIIDAMVDAEFTAFDVSDNLTLNFRPSVITHYDMIAAVGMKLSIGF